jgi:hypothetical protein
MSSRKLTIIIATIIIVIAAWNVSQKKAPTTKMAADRLYPQLLDRLNDAQRVSIKTARNLTELTHGKEGWVVANRDNFPANFATVKDTLLNLAAATVIEEKTSKPDNYGKLGVAGIEAEKSPSVLIEVSSTDAAPFAALIIGNKRTSNQQEIPSYFVRKADGDTALLVKAELMISDDPLKWMDTSVLSVVTERVRSVTISRAERTSIVVSKEKRGDNFFSLQKIPTGFVPTSRATVSSLGSLLLDVKFQDVLAATRVLKLAVETTATVQTFDGLVATLERIEADDKIVVRYSFAFDPEIVVVAEPKSGDEEAETPSVADEVDELNAKVESWVYVLPNYKIRLLDKNFDDMIKPAETAETN